MNIRIRAILIWTGAALALFFVLLTAHNYQFLMRQHFKVNSWAGAPMRYRAYIAAGAVYDAALMTVSGLETSVGASEPPVASRLKSVRLRIAKGALDELVSDVPESAKARYHNALLQYPDGNWRRINFRLRGRSNWHFLPDKPSLRLKLRRSDPINLLRHINLINPEDRPMLSNIVADDLARRMGVLAHVSEMVRVFINGRYRGVYQLQTREDEEMLRRNWRLPGPIYLGDFLKVPWRRADFSVAGDAGVLETLDFDPLEEMLAAVYAAHGPDRYARLWSILDFDKFAALHAATALVGSLHIDVSHNQIFYFDSSTGLLEPMISDANGHGMHNYPRTWRRLVRAEVPDHRMRLNEMNHPLLDAALRDPRFHHRRNQILYAALTGIGSVEAQTELIRAYTRAMDADVYADRHKGALRDSFVGVIRLPYTNRQFEDAKADMLEWVRKRNAFLLDKLGDSRARVVVSGEQRGGRTLFFVEVDGNAAVTFDTGAFEGGLLADRDLDGKPATPVAGPVLLHPGLSEDPNTYYEHILFLKRWPPHVLAPGVQRYLFAADAAPGDVARIARGAFANSLSGDPVTTEVVTAAALDPASVRANAVSVHPWRFAPEPAGEVVLGPGVVILKDDLIVGPRQSLVVRPGTELRLGPGVSIAARGRVRIVGRADERVRIRRLDPDRAWGAIVVQGQSARDSRIAHAEIAGGSHATLFNVPYSGMVNVHWADGFRLENSTLAGNVISDDTLHVVHSRFSVSDAQFRDCFGDCIDLDYADGSIAGLRIYGAGNDGVDFMTSTVTVRDAAISQAGDKGLSVGELSQVVAEGGAIGHAPIGIAVKDRSTLDLRRFSLASNGIAIDVYKKNWRYGGPGEADIAEIAFEANTLDIRVAKNGRVVIAGEVGALATEGAGEIVFRPPGGAPIGANSAGALTANR